MKYVLWPFGVLYKLYYALMFSVVMIIMYPIYLYLMHSERRFPSAFRVIRVHAFILMALAGIFVRVKGAERIPENEPFIVCANHTSFLDSFCMYIFITRYFVFTGKKEIEKWPLFHIFYTSGMNILVDRNSSAGSLGALKRMTQEIKRGRPIVIFPEGTRSFDGPNVGAFKPGAFALAIQTQVPILPVSFRTNWKRLGGKGMFRGLAGPGISDLIIHPPVSTTGMTKDDVGSLLNKVHEIISGPLTARQ